MAGHHTKKTSAPIRRREFEGNQMSDWFERNQFGSPVPGKIYTVHFNWTKSMQEPEEHYSYKKKEDRSALGYIIPPFQRELVWTEEQKIRFVDSARRCVPLGTYTVNLTFGIPACKRFDGSREYYMGESWLLDGQQRLNALEEFFENKFPVHGMFWRDLDQGQQRQFLMTPNFSFYETQFQTELECRQYYDLMNFSGTPHREHERAMKV
jgi:hypothetical protein